MLIGKENNPYKIYNAKLLQSYNYKWEFCYIPYKLTYKTGLQPVSRPVEKVHYFEGWGVGAKYLANKTLQIDKHTGMAVMPDA